jgi:hypothetical protein
MNPLAMIPAAWRAALYAFAGVANLVVIYLAATGKVGTSEVALVAGIVSFLGLGTAGSNLTRDPTVPAPLTSGVGPGRLTGYGDTSSSSSSHPPKVGPNT